MKPGVARCKVLVLSEDSGEQAHDTLASLARKMFRIIDPQCQTQHIRFEPPDNENARRALRGNLWKSRELRDQARRRDLIGYIATTLFEGPRSFVLFHVDGDMPFRAAKKANDGAAAESENVQKFRAFIEREVMQLVEHRRKTISRTTGSAPAPTGDETRKLLLAVPYYSIEAWLFQNVERAKQLCLSHPTCGGAHVEMLDEWARRRELLDEVEKPKEKVCFRDSHNRDLAGAGYPADEVYDARASFAETVDRLLECPMLIEALRSTHGL